MRVKLTGAVPVMKTSADQMDYNRFMGTALDLAEKALTAGEFPVGCVLVANNKIIATGSRKGTINNSDNEIDHAEMVALRNLSESSETIDKSDISLFSSLEPCLMCFGAIILSGITKIVYAYEDVMGGGTTCDLSQLTPLYQRHPITVVPGIFRARSLNLFKDFFNNRDHHYWQGSLLAEYTLGQ